MESSTYFGDWNSEADMLRDFQIDESALGGAGLQVMFAEYRIDGYEGYATVLLRRIVPNDGALFEVYAYHCSCYGLENQWQPEATTIASLRLRASREGAWYTVPHRDVLSQDHRNRCGVKR